MKLPPSSSRQKRTRQARAFTLIELLVALTGGLFFSIFVFMFSRDVSRFFQRETRVSDATFSAVSGFQRLSSDLARAAFMASPNLVKDPGRCPRPLSGSALSTLTSAAWTKQTALREMGLARVTVGGSPTTSFLSNNGLTPDMLRLYGNYTSAESFPVRDVGRPVSGKITITLNPNSGAMLRIGMDVNNSTQATALLAANFPAGRALRLLNQQGEEQYGIITETKLDSKVPQIVLDVTSSGMPLIFKSDAGTTCGFRGRESGVSVNVVNIIRYSLRDLSDASKYPALVDLFPTGKDKPDFEATRLDLVREELDPSGAVLDGSQELVAEYAVDFKLSLSVVGDLSLLTRKTIDEGSGDLLKYAGNPTDSSEAYGTNVGPHLIRGIHVRLAVRARAPDKEANIGAVTGVNAGLYRVALTKGTSGLKDWVRVRTLQSQIATRNHRNSLWN